MGVIIMPVGYCFSIDVETTSHYFGREGGGLGVVRTFLRLGRRFDHLLSNGNVSFWHREEAQCIVHGAFSRVSDAFH